MLVWSGFAESEGRFSAEGARYDPVTDTWRTTPTAPIEARANAVTVWTGQEMLVWGGHTGSSSLWDGATFNPTSGEWRKIPPPLGQWQRDISAGPGVWSGDRLIVSLSDGALLVYTPGLSTRPWRRVDGVESRFGYGSVMVWTGDATLLWGGAHFHGVRSEGVLWEPAVADDRSMS